MHSPVSEDDLIVTFHKRVGVYNMDRRHQHDRHEVYYLLSGERDYFVRDRVYRVRAGDVVVIPANDLHKTHAVGTSGYERMLIEFSDGFLGAVLDAVGAPGLLALFRRETPVLRVPEAQRPPLGHLFTRLLEEFGDPRPGGAAVLRALVVELLVLLNRLDAAPAGPDHPSPHHQLVSEVGRYLNGHYAEDLGLETTARRFGLSPSSLSRIFVQVTGVNFGDYLTTLRLRQARDLLASGDLSVAEVARATGYRSQTSFGRAFSRTVGLPPLRWRALNRQASVS